MNITDPTLNIRGMNEMTVNLEFADAQYSSLDDQLKAKLAIRRQELLARKSAEIKISKINRVLIS